MEVCWQANPLSRPSTSAILRDNVVVTKPAATLFHPALSTPHSPSHPYIPLPSSAPAAPTPMAMSHQIASPASLPLSLEIDGESSVHLLPIPNRPNVLSTRDDVASPPSLTSVRRGLPSASRMDEEAKVQMHDSASTAGGDGWGERASPQDMCQRLKKSSLKRNLDMSGTKTSSGATLALVAEIPLVPPVLSVAESAPTVKATFKWVRGELIGKGTYGRVYLATNATTGEAMAIKQVNLPRTPSDRNDEAQVRGCSGFEVGD
ncbi:mitogen-activated protein kinase kinase kinase [Marasmius tenuissimus]|nr:mitogen-activated protein kinase kinase kinase [Marasmius tenuissimus]